MSEDQPYDPESGHYFTPIPAGSPYSEGQSSIDPSALAKESMPHLEAEFGKGNITLEDNDQLSWTTVDGETHHLGNAVDVADRYGIRDQVSIDIESVETTKDFGYPPEWNIPSDYYRGK